MNHRLVLIASLSVWLIASPARAQYSGLVIFGDSLSDVGNVSNQTGGLAPGSSYYMGRYSNGPLWIEQLALEQSLPAPAFSRPAPGAAGDGMDYAFSGTKTGSGFTNYFIFFNFPNLGTQINNYLGTHTPSADELFVVWGGGNDFIGGQTNPSVPVTNISNHITALANEGAKHFLVPNLPPLGSVPRFLGTGTASTMNSRTSSFNSQLATMLNGLETTLNVQIHQLDVAGFFGAVLGDPSAFGFSNVTGQALNGSTVVPNPDQYLFWDDIHPTRVAHGLLGTMASDLLDTHTWIAAGPTEVWSGSGNWDPGGSPQSRWIVKLSNSSGTARTAVVDVSSNVRRIELSGTSGLMTLEVMAGVTLGGSERVRISGGGQIELQGGTLATPLLENIGGTIEGFGTIGGNLDQDGLGRIKVKFPNLPAESGPVLHIAGEAALDGELAVSFESGQIVLPGQTRDVLTFGSITGDVEVVNETGLAGLSFVKTFTATALSLTTAALPGDANLDGLVDLRDLFELSQHWLAGGDWLGGDFDQSGFVDKADLSFIAQNWQSGVSGGSLDEALDLVGLSGPSVPEPAVLVLGLGAMLVRRRTRPA